MDAKVEPGTLVDGLENTLRGVERVGRQLPAAQLKRAPVAGWSANEILWHIRAQSDVYGEHIARILEEDEPRWRHVSPRARMKKVRYDLLEFGESAAAFRTQRIELVARLRALPEEAWERAGLVRVAHREGDWRLTLKERVQGMVSHEQSHWGQLEAVLGEG